MTLKKNNRGKEWHVIYQDMFSIFFSRKEKSYPQLTENRIAFVLMWYIIKARSEKYFLSKEKIIAIDDRCNKKEKCNTHRKEVNDDGKKEKSSKKDKAFQQKEESDEKKEALVF